MSRFASTTAAAAAAARRTGEELPLLAGAEPLAGAMVVDSVVLLLACPSVVGM